MNKIIKNTLILTAITVVSGFLLGIVYDVTKNRSLRRKSAQNKKRFKQCSPKLRNLKHMKRLMKKKQLKF